MTITPFDEDAQFIATSVITVWSGNISNIPSGHLICDGNNGTPNLTDRFVKGTTSGESPGSTGGQSSWTPSTSNMPSHTHSGSTDYESDHNHGSSLDYFSDDDFLLDDSGGRPIDSGGDSSSSFSNDYAGSHSHNVDVDSTGVSSPTSVDNNPQYYEVAFIMKT